MEKQVNANETTSDCANAGTGVSVLLSSECVQCKSDDDDLNLIGATSQDTADIEENVVRTLFKNGSDSSMGVDLFSGEFCSQGASYFSDSGDSSSHDVSIDSDYFPSGEIDGMSAPCSSLDLSESRVSPKKVKKSVTKREFIPIVDDSNDEDFMERLRELDPQESSEGEIFKEISGTLKLSRRVWDRLYKYQKQGVIWLSELHEQYVGGILADEMGLGKTVQVIAFLRAVDESLNEDRYMNFTGLGPSLIICPSTLLRQWVKEIHIWMPQCRVAILHSTGNFKGSRRALISKMAVNRRGGSILVTTYSTFQKFSNLLLPQSWHYVVLDEGHKIRNPKARISETVKQLHTPCRIILSGTPLQNSLTEIWSLMDFVYAGKLSSLETFAEKFAKPITQGGYANATKQQLLTAYKCATVLRDAISPFILRRMKKNVQKSLDLPQKNEKVLFCELSSEQRHLYLEYLKSRECQNIFKGRLDAFVGLTTLRKLCNHPDFISGGPNRHGDFDESEDPSKSFGFYNRSGKMRVLFQLLDLWRSNEGEKVLIFSQSRKMLDILERKMRDDKYSYLRMDGGTGIGGRQKKVERFNEDPEIFIFLLTTRVGGLGINLTAANKVVIFDPDWNPSTDTQAKERSWRIGQERAVTIYRLLCAGTIEEKIYHRQIFKQFLANRILKDPKQRQFFKTNDLHDLFSFSDVHKDSLTETGSLFASETDEIRLNSFINSDKNRKHESKSKKSRKHAGDSANEDFILSEAKKKELHKRAKHLSRKLGRITSSGAELRSNTRAGQSNSISPNSGSADTKVKRDELEEEHSRVSPESKPSCSKSMSSKISDRCGGKGAETHGSNKSSDDFVLNCLLQSAGVRCAIEHDDLVDDKSSDYLIEKEAASVANRAAKTLGKRSNRSFVRQFCSSFPSYSENKPIYDSSQTLPFQGGAAKNSVLASLHARKRKLDGTVPSDVVLKDKYVEIAEKVRDFMRKSGGRAFTENITTNFKSLFEENKPQFRAIVWKLCELDPLKREWHLRSEYW